MIKILASLLFIFTTFSIAADDTYVFEAKGEFAKELKTLMDKYAKEGKIEIKKVEEKVETETVGIVEAFLNNEEITGNVEIGKKIYNNRCFTCHGINANDSKYNNARKLSTLNKKTLVDQIEAYGSTYNENHGGSTRVIMHEAVVGMSTSEIVSVSSYIYSLNHDTKLPTSVNSTQVEEEKEAPTSYLQ